MSIDPETTRIVRAWLDDGVTRLPDRVLDVVLDQVPATPQRRARWLAGTPVIGKFMPVGLGVAAVVLIAFAGIEVLGPSGPSGVGGGHAASPSARPSTSASPSPSRPPAGLSEGLFLILSGGGDSPANATPPLTVTIPAPGWEGVQARGVLRKDWEEPAPGAGMIIFTQRAFEVFGDPCKWRSSMPDEPATTVDALVAALSSQPGRDASQPVDITLGGYAGKAVTLHIPDDADLSGCDQGTYASWNCGGSADPVPCGFHMGPGETDVEYLLDVDGALMVWHTAYEAGAPTEVIAELESIVQSAKFGE